MRRFYRGVLRPVKGTGWGSAGRPLTEAGHTAINGAPAGQSRALLPHLTLTRTGNRRAVTLSDPASSPATEAVSTTPSPWLAFLCRLGIGLLLLGAVVDPAFGAGGGETAGDSIWDQVAADHRGFYSRDSLLALTVGVGVSGMLAHTSLDTGLRDFYQDNLRSPFTDGVADGFRLAGDVRVAVPLYLSGFLVGKVLPESAVGTACGEWGGRTLRAFVLGAPPVLLLENLVGSSEPEDGGDSEWHPFQDDAGVSGHAFLGAVTFLSAAHMAEGAGAKGALVAVSVLPGLSRINDDQHYLSQVALGWLIGFLAVQAVDVVPEWPIPMIVSPGSVGGSPGVILSRVF